MVVESPDAPPVGRTSEAIVSEAPLNRRDWGLRDWVGYFFFSVLAPRRYTDLWNYGDLVLFVLFNIAAAIPAAIISVIGALTLAVLIPSGLTISEASAEIYLMEAFGLISTALGLLFIYYVVAIKHRLPFFEALGFVRARTPIIWFAASGVLMSLGLAGLGELIEFPTGTPFEEMMRNVDTLWLMIPMGVVVAPVVEEITFRSFLFRPMVRSHGAVVAILITTAIFTVLHGSQYDWHWEILLFVAVLGLSFGYVRWKTGSLWPPIAMHMVFNGTQFALMLLSGELPT